MFHGGPPDGDYDDVGDGTWYYLTDNLRSVVAVVDAAGKLVERVVYGPFGKSQHHFAGDVNGDGAADFLDVQHMLALTASGATPAMGDAAYDADADVNADGTIDSSETRFVLNHSASSNVQTKRGPSRGLLITSTK